MCVSLNSFLANKRKGPALTGPLRYAAGERYFLTVTPTSCASPAPLALSNVTIIRPIAGVIAHSAELTEILLLVSVPFGATEPAKPPVVIASPRR